MAKAPKTNPAETKVREAASALLEAVREARAVGLRVDWPGSFDGLGGLGISETGASADPNAAPLVTTVAPADAPAAPEGAKP